MTSAGWKGAELVNNFAVACAATGADKKADDAFRKAVALNEKQISFRRNYASFLNRRMTRKKIGRILSVLPKEIAVSDEDAILLLANILDEGSRSDEAIELLQSSLVHCPDSVRIRCILGYLLGVRANELDRGISILREAHRIDSNDALAANNLSYLLIQKGELREAHKIMQPWVRKFDESSIKETGLICMLATWGLLLIRRGGYEEGISFYRSARSNSSGLLRARIEQRMLIEEAVEAQEQGKLNIATQRLRKAKSMAVDREFTAEAQRLLSVDRLN